MTIDKNKNTDLKDIFTHKDSGHFKIFPCIRKYVYNYVLKQSRRQFGIATNLINMLS